MNSIKCKSCGLINLQEDASCRRCGNGLMGNASSTSRSPRDAAKRGFPFFSLILIGGVIAFIVYVYTGIREEMARIEAGEVQRIATQPPPTGLTRAEYEQRRAAQTGNAVQNNSGLAESQRHNNEVQKVMRPGANQS